jgi:hypothetical protein
MLTVMIVRGMQQLNRAEAAIVCPIGLVSAQHGNDNGDELSAIKLLFYSRLLD